MADLAEIGPLIAALPPNARNRVIASGEPAAKERQLEKIGATRVEVDGGFELVGPNADAPTAYAELRALEDDEQAEREVSPAWREQHREHERAWTRLRRKMTDEVRRPSRLERVLRALVRVVARLRPRRREHRATSRRSRRTQGSSRGDPPGEPPPPSSDRGRR